MAQFQDNVEQPLELEHGKSCNRDCLSFCLLLRRASDWLHRSPRADTAPAPEPARVYSVRYRLHCCAGEAGRPARVGVPARARRGYICAFYFTNRYDGGERPIGVDTFEGDFKSPEAQKRG